MSAFVLKISETSRRRCRVAYAFHVGSSWLLPSDVRATKEPLVEVQGPMSRRSRRIRSD
jgi:hypothetical protein